MINGNIPCTWTKENFSQLTYELKVYDPDYIREYGLLTDPNDLDRYKIVSSFYKAKDLNLENYKFIDKHFTWLQDKQLQVNRLDSGMIIPLHVDYLKHNDHKKLTRILLFLEDWKPGQYVEVAGKGFCNWVAGDWIGFDLNEIHLTANLGHSSRYILQITGIKI